MKKPGEKSKGTGLKTSPQPKKRKKPIVLPTAPKPPMPLGELIWQRYCVLLEIKKKLYGLKAVHEELERVRRGRNFQIWNDIVWTTLLDARDKCYNDLYGFTVELRHGMPYFDLKTGTKKTPKGHKKNPKFGLLIYLRDHYCGQLSRTYRPKNPDHPKDLFNEDQAKIEKMFNELFPNCAADSPSADDIDDVCRALQQKVEPLRSDRNENRIHVYERGEVVSSPRMLDFEELEELFEYCEDLLRSFHLLMGKGVLADDMNMNRADCKATARDLIDLVLFGNFDDVRQVFRDKPRDEVYDRLHQLYEELADDEDGPKCFNNVQNQPEFLKEIGVWGVWALHKA